MNSPPLDSRNSTPRHDHAVKFLKNWRPGGPWALTAIHPENRKIETQTLRSPDSVREFLDHFGKSHNIYFSTNPTTGPLSKKAKRKDIAEVAWLHVDVDPRTGEDPESERVRILGLLKKPPGELPRPTLIVDSGGGYQGFWKLEEPIPINGNLDLANEAALYNKQIETILGADSCHNVDRIMRLPGTVNRPNEKKRNNGRVEALAKVVEWDPDSVYPISAFTKAPKSKSATPRSSGHKAKISAPLTPVSLDDLPESVTDLTKAVIVHGKDPDDPSRFEKDRGTGELDRSRALFYVCCELVRADCTDEQAFSVITNPEFRISDSVLDKGSRSDQYALRQVERAREHLDELACDDNDKPKPTIENIRKAITKIGVTLEHDMFAGRFRIRGLDDFGPYLDDLSTNRIMLLVEERFGLRVGKERFWSITQDTALMTRRHPVREYLDSLRWDQQPRLDRLFSTYFGAEDTPFNRSVGAIALIAAVRRVRQPGCKFDEMIVLEGSQGRGKSSTLRVLAVRDEWFNDDLPLGASLTTFFSSSRSRRDEFGSPGSQPTRLPSGWSRSLGTRLPQDGVSSAGSGCSRTIGPRSSAKTFDRCFVDPASDL